MARASHSLTRPSGGVPAIGFSQFGSGQDIILLHGALATRQDMNLALAPALARHFRVTTFDRPGHGQSGRCGPSGSPTRQADAIAMAARELGIERPLLVGHSFGAAVAMAFAIQHPASVAGVLALAPIAFPEARLEHWVFGPRGLPGAGRIANRMATKAVDPVLLPLLWRVAFAPQRPPADFVKLFPFPESGRPSQMEAEGEDAVLLNFGLVLNAMNYFRCRAAVRILVGDQDKVVDHSRQGRPLSQILPAGAYEELPGLGHMFHHFAQSAILEVLEAMCAQTE